MPKITSKELRKAILEALKDGQAYSLSALEKKLGSNWHSVKSHIDDLFLFGAVIKKEFEKHDKNGRQYIEATITKEGLALLRKL